jgi:DNA mismatch endonuclease (patch repair protein)
VDGTRKVKSNEDYWTAKIVKNCERDARNMAALEKSGWKVIVIWECDTKSVLALEELFASISTLPKRQTKNQ